MPKRSILAVDDDESLRKIVAYNLRNEGYEVETASGGAEALAVLSKRRFDVVVTDVRMPEVGGMQVLRAVKKDWPRTSVIVITAFGTISDAVEAMKAGASDYIQKPFGKDELLLAVRRAVERLDLEDENRSLRADLSRLGPERAVIAASAAMTGVMRTVEKVAGSDATVLITGESGTGKELVARAIHDMSARRGRPFITVNCAAIPANLIESELFGHVKGAFTGATRDRTGKFEAADEGTIFLDEVAELDTALQARLLRVLQEREIDVVGGAPRKIDARVIAATNRDLAAAKASGQFREDLFFRLNVIPIYVPPLRKRKEDTMVLIEHFLRKLAPNKDLSISEEAIKALLGYRWPGNVRELENVCERTVLLRKADVISVEDVPPDILGAAQIATPARPAAAGLELPDAAFPLHDLERDVISRSLAKHGNNKSKTARYLDVPRHVLLYKMKKLGVK